MTQNWRRKIVKLAITIGMIFGGVWLSLQPTGLVNAADTIPNCTDKNGTAGGANCNDVCKIFGNCPTVLDNANSTNGLSTVASVITLVANSLIGLAALVSVFFIIYAGWMILSGGGEGKSDGIKEGQKMLINAFIGLAVTILSFVIVQYTVGFIDTLFKKS
jgi:hypothetical protein